MELTAPNIDGRSNGLAFFIGGCFGNFLADSVAADDDSGAFSLGATSYKE
jgi:hypothetical protein